MGRFLRSWCLQERFSYKMAEGTRNYPRVSLISALVRLAEITNRVSVHVDKYILRKIPEPLQRQVLIPKRGPSP